MDQTVTIMFEGDQKNVVSKNRANIKKWISKNGFEYNLKIKNQYPQSWRSKMYYSGEEVQFWQL